MSATSIDDIRDRIFRDVMDRKVTAEIRVEGEGILAGVDRAREKAYQLGLEVKSALSNGTKVRRGNVVLKVRGNPKQVALAEDLLIGLMSKASGVATAARRAFELSGGSFRVVSGAWKKMPYMVKDVIREAVVVGGVSPRIVDEPFIYLDKNYIKVFGGAKRALKLTEDIVGKVVVQLRAEGKDVGEEAVEAVEAGADIVMVDTGKLEDVNSVVGRLSEAGLKGKVKVCFAGGVKIEDIPKLRGKNIDIVEVGRDIIDAGLLDMRMDVVKVEDSGA